MYTIKNFQISEITCEDNVSYKDSNTVKTKYYVHIDENEDVFVRGVHQINGRYYYKERNRRQYFDTEVPMENIYILDRYYRTNKSNGQLKMMVMRIELMESEVPLPYSCMIYSLDDECPDDVTEIKYVSHGNNKKQKTYHSLTFEQVNRSSRKWIRYLIRKNLQMYLTSCWGIRRAYVFIVHFDRTKQLQASVKPLKH